MMKFKNMAIAILPKGKYNGRIIEGFSLKFSVHLLDFYLVPVWGGKYNQAVFWLWFTVRYETEYASRMFSDD